MKKKTIWSLVLTLALAVSAIGATAVAFAATPDTAEPAAAIATENEDAIWEQIEAVEAKSDAVFQRNAALWEKLDEACNALPEDYNFEGFDEAEFIRGMTTLTAEEKAALLTEHGYPADALDDKPACPKCSDTGWVGANMCACLKALCTEEQIRELSKLLDLGEQSFDSFSLDYYSPLPWPGESLSPRENMEFIFDVCSSYARKFGRFYFRNLFLTGAPGLGKTFLSACIARVVSEDGFSVVYDTAGHVFSQFESAKFRRDDDGDTAGEDVERCMNCDLLILDDLGTEMTTSFVQSALYQLLNGRLLAGKSTVISTNLDPEELGRRYGAPLLSRLEGEYQLLPFVGEDVRKLKKNRC